MIHYSAILSLCYLQWKNNYSYRRRLNHTVNMDIQVYIKRTGSQYFQDKTLLFKCTLSEFLTDACSSWYRLNAGVPQGCVLGPLLFTLYINNIAIGLENCQVHLYADDRTLYSSVTFNTHNNFKQRRQQTVQLLGHTSQMYLANLSHWFSL